MVSLQGVEQSIQNRHLVQPSKCNVRVFELPPPPHAPLVTWEAPKTPNKPFSKFNRPVR